MSRVVAIGLIGIVILLGGCTWWDDRRAQAEVDEKEQKAGAFFDDIEVPTVEKLDDDRIEESEGMISTAQMPPSVRIAVTEEVVQVDNIAWIAQLIEEQPEYGAKTVLDFFGGEEFPFVYETLELSRQDPDKPKATDPELRDVLWDATESIRKVRESDGKLDGGTSNGGEEHGLLLMVDRDVEFEVVAPILGAVGYDVGFPYVGTMVFDESETPVILRQSTLAARDWGGTEYRQQATTYCAGLHVDVMPQGVYARLFAVASNEDGDRDDGSKLADSQIPDWDEQQLRGVDGQCPAVVSEDEGQLSGTVMESLIEDVEEFASHCDVKLTAADDISWQEVAGSLGALASATDRLARIAVLPETRDGESEARKLAAECENDGIRPDDDRLQIVGADDLDDEAVNELRDREVASEEGALAVLDSDPVEALDDEVLRELQNMADDEPAGGPPSGDGGMAGEVNPRQPDVDGPLDSEIVARVVRQNRRGIQRCYDQEITKEPDIRGEITFQWTISPSGEVGEATVEKTEVDHQQLEDCVTGRMDRWSFPEPRDGDSAYVTQAFEFDVQ